MERKPGAAAEMDIKYVEDKVRPKPGAAAAMKISLCCVVSGGSVCRQWGV